MIPGLCELGRHPSGSSGAVSNKSSEERTCDLNRKRDRWVADRVMENRWTAGPGNGGPS